MSAGSVQRGDLFLKGFQLVDDLVLRRLQVSCPFQPTHCRLGCSIRAIRRPPHPPVSCVKKTRERHAVQEMKEDPSEPSCRGRLQTAISCFGQKPRW